MTFTNLAADDFHFLSNRATTGTARIRGVLDEEIANDFDVLSVDQWLEVDHLLVTSHRKITIFVPYECTPAAHAGGEVAPVEPITTVTPPVIYSQQ